MSKGDSISAYLERIGYGGSAEASFDTLCGIVAAHATSIPFENLDVLLGRPIRLDFPSLIDKLVLRRRGGYCFEHNTLLLGVLEALGFAVEGLAARVVWLQPEGQVGPRTHMLLRVSLPEGRFLVDVGFGGLTLTAPLVMDTGAEQATPHEPHRLVADGNATELQARLGDEWVPLYRFTDERHHPIDYEVGNWFTSTRPDGLFTNNLLAARPDPDRRYALLNGDFTVRHSDGRVERRTLQDAHELAEVLARDFQVSLPDFADVVAVTRRIGVG